MQGPGRARHAGARGARAGQARAGEGRARRGRSPFGKPAARRIYHSLDLRDAAAVAKVVDDGPRAARARRRAAARGRSGREPLPPRQVGPGVRAGLRRQERRLVQPARTQSTRCRWAPPCASARSPARFGNGGQTDYSAANDLLCKTTSSFRATTAGDARHRHRLDRLGRHRHGHAWLHPQDDGDGRASTCCRPRPAFPGSAGS